MDGIALNNYPPPEATFIILTWSSSTLPRRLDAPHIEGGFNEGKCQPMVLLTKLKDKKAIAWDGGIGGAIAVPSTRLRLLSVCVEGSIGQNGLFGGSCYGM